MATATLTGPVPGTRAGPAPGTAMDGADGETGDVEALRLDVSAMRRWLECVCVVNFDLELGQSLETTFPATTFGDEDRGNISFLSFPDSNARMGDTLFSFRFRRSEGRLVRPSVALMELQPGDPELESATASVEEERFSYGFVYFRQERDSSISRGYLQKSVVIITDLPYVSLFMQVMRVLGRCYFEHGAPLLETFCNDVARWPAPRISGAFDVPVLGDVLQVSFGDSGECVTTPTGFNTTGGTFASLIRSPRGASGTEGSGEPSIDHRHATVDLQQRVLGVSIAGVSLYRNLFSLISEMWRLWELVLLGEPIVLLADSPDICSRAVLSLVSMIRPLAYQGDFRPFFTIHDHDFHRFARMSDSYEREGADAVILGVTNPFFFKALEGWPHQVTLDHRGMTTLSPQLQSPTLARSLPAFDTGSVSASEDGLGSSDGTLGFGVQGGRSGGRGGRKKKKKKKSTGGRASSVVSTHKGYLPIDKSLVKRILGDTTPTGDSAGRHDKALRRTFESITSAFLMPLERYFATLMPLDRSITAFSRMPALRPWDNAAFMATIPEGGASSSDVEATLGPLLAGLGKKIQWVALYERFLQSCNFEGWLRDRRRTAIERIRGLYLSRVYDADIPAWMHDQSEIEVIDLLLRLRHQEMLLALDLEAEHDGLPSAVVRACGVSCDRLLQRVTEHISVVIAGLPEDLRLSLQHNVLGIPAASPGE